MINRMEKASIFLMQTTHGADHAMIEHVAEIGIENWLERQLRARPDDKDSFAYETVKIWRHFRKMLLARHGKKAINGDGNNPALPYKYYFRMAWWQRTLGLKNNSLHHVRHRVAQALSEILVISDNSILEVDAIGMASFYDILYRNAFGNYQDILQEVSLHPCMGVYLSHMNNGKADPSKNIHPDENYAREIMQLFSLGLYDLNQDGTRSAGDTPTYDNDDIRAMARVFTGLKASEYRYEWGGGDFFPYNGEEIFFDDGIDKTNKMPPYVNMTKPMIMDEGFHDKKEKTFLKGNIRIPAGQLGLKDIKDAVNALVSHPNTAPFIVKKLIQQFVTSNPSKKYVQDVAQKFGENGDLKAVVRKIFLHPEASRPQKLKSPLLRVTQVLRAFKVHNKSGKLWVTGDDIKDSTNHHPLSSPTVFNFYKPDFTPHGPIEEKGLVAPEFELQNAATSVAYINMMYAWLLGDYLPLVSTQISSSLPNIAETDFEKLNQNLETKLLFDFKAEIPLASDPARHSELIDRIALVLTGKKQLPIKDEIRLAYKYYDDNPLWVIQTIIFLIAISPEFTVLEA